LVASFYSPKVSLNQRLKSENISLALRPSPTIRLVGIQTIIGITSPSELKEDQRNVKEGRNVRFWKLGYKSDKEDILL